MSKETFAQCWSLDQYTHICPFEIPSFTRQPNADICELALLAEDRERAQACDFHQVKPHNILIKLLNQDQYYFSLLDRLVVRQNCYGKSTEFILQQSGLIVMPRGCTIFCNEFTIMAQSPVRLTHRSELIIPNRFFHLNIRYNNKIPIKFSREFPLSEQVEAEDSMQKQSREIPIRKIEVDRFQWPELSFATAVFLGLIITSAAIALLFRRIREATNNNTVVTFHREESVV